MSSTPRIDLVLVGDDADRAVDWPVGKVTTSSDQPAALARAVESHLASESPVGLLIWQPSLLSLPAPGTVVEIFAGRGDVWHLGLQLGLGGQPRLLDFVHPTWMLNRDPPSDIEATSWRLSLRACLLRTDVWRQMGAPIESFTSLDGASLAVGHRWLMAGAVPRHAPSLASQPPPACRPTILLVDQVRFLRHRVGGKWCAWALMRAVLDSTNPKSRLWSAWRSTRHEPIPAPAETPATTTLATSQLQTPPHALGDHPSLTVSVLIPTLDRYPYLNVILDQLGEQTVRPLEILVIDQTENERRQHDIEQRFPDLPLRVWWRDQPGQCTSRNAGLRAARGDVVLFLDDDDEIEPDLIERHLRLLEATGADACCGVAREGDGELPSDFQRRRASDVFPTNNGSVRRRALRASGLFDLAYERGARADIDLGMRLYSSGALSILDPSISVVHHHAPRGGLRRHKARTSTYSSSRRRLLGRRLPEPTEFYYTGRYFTPAQAREMRVLAIAGTFGQWGHVGRRALKILIALVQLPGTIAEMQRRRQAAERLADEHPTIPSLEAEPAPHDPPRDHSDPLSLGRGLG